jgi:hypothetical protein
MSQPQYEEEMEQAVIGGFQSAASDSAAASAAVAAVSSASVAASASPVADPPLPGFGASGASSATATVLHAEEQKDEDETKHSFETHVALVYALKLYVLCSLRA